ncbi:MAG: MogA/MoaB family molybdenum cofactor biosynthesis protein [Solirubrobacterales bacterium]
MERVTGDATGSGPPGAAILTVSSSRARDGGADESGDALAAFAESVGIKVLGRELLADDREAIEACLRRWAAAPGCDLILTTGGTGLSPDDLTPEASEAVIERRAPGIAEAMRAASAAHTGNWMLSRGTAGVAGTTLIVNFPGNPKAIGEAGAAIAAALPHAVGLLRGGRGGHGR